MTATLRAAILLGLVMAVGSATSGCVYRPNIQQGNLLKVEDVDQVQVGMTRSQVRYLLGTPMLADPFDPQRWDYIYTFRRGRESRIDRAHFVVRFDGDKVSKVEKLDLPDGASSVGTTRQTKPEASAEPGHEPPAPPPSQQRQPDAPRPGGGSNNPGG